MWKRCRFETQPSDSHQPADEISSYAWRGESLIEPSNARPSLDETSEDELSIERNKYRESLKDEKYIGTYAWHSDESIKKNHSILLPRDVRAIIVGKSGCGKTTLLTYLLLEPDMIDYENLMVCRKSTHQPEYRDMQLRFNKGLSKN